MNNIANNAFWGQRIYKNEQNKYVFRKIKLQDLHISKPSILILGGNATISNLATNGYIKQIEKLLGIKNNDQLVDIYSINYSKCDKTTGNINNEEIEQIINSTFLPLITDNNGKKLDKKFAIRNIRNINIFTHCLGAKVVDIIFDNLYDKMLNKLKYDTDDIKDILSQVVHISYAPLTCNNKNITNIYFKSLDDKKVLTFKNELLEFQHKPESQILSTNLNNEPYLNICEIYKNNNSIHIYTNKLNNLETNDSHCLSEVIKKDNWIIREYHRADTISTLMSFALSIAINNSIENYIKQNEYYPLLSIDDFVNYLSINLANEKNSYKETKFKRLLEQQTKRYNNLISFQEYLTQNNITEEELINGKADTDKIIADINTINFNNSNYSSSYFIFKIISHFKYEIIKNTISITTTNPKQEFIVLQNGDVVINNLKSLTNSIALRIKNYDLKNSVKISIENNFINSKVYVSPNYESYGKKKVKSIEELLINWDKENIENLHYPPIVLSSLQTTAIYNVLNFLNITKENEIILNNVKIQKLTKKEKIKE